MKCRPCAATHNKRAASMKALADHIYRYPPDTCSTQLLLAHPLVHLCTDAKLPAAGPSGHICTAAGALTDVAPASAGNASHARIQHATRMHLPALPSPPVPFLSPCLHKQNMHCYMTMAQTRAALSIAQSYIRSCLLHCNCSHAYPSTS